MLLLCEDPNIITTMGGYIIIGIRGYIIILIGKFIITSIGGNIIIAMRGYIITVVSKVKLATVVEGDPKAPFSIGATPSSRLLHFTLDTYLIMLSVEQGGIKYHF